MKTILNKTLAVTALLMISGGLLAQNAATPQAGFVLSESAVFYLLFAMAVMQLIVIMVIGNTIKGLSANKHLWIEKFKNAGKAAMVLGFVALASNAQAQTADAVPFIQMTDGMYIFMFGLNGFLLFVVLYLLNVLKTMVSSLRTPEEIAEASKAPSFIESLGNSLTDAVPIEREAEVMTDHDYDGIRELDNNLPPWWVWGFYFTIINAFLYIGYYHFGSGKLQTEEYQDEVAEAQVLKARLKDMVNETTVTLLTDAETMKKGAAIFKTNCVTCHRADMGGSVGPNLTDDYWIHGGDIKDLFKTVKYGVPAKGMISWESQLSPAEIQAVTSYIKLMYGTNPVDPKEPQGEFWSAAGAEPIAAPTETMDSSATVTADTAATVTTASIQ